MMTGEETENAFFLCFAAIRFLFLYTQCRYPITMGLDFQIENVIDILSVVPRLHSMIFVIMFLFIWIKLCYYKNEKRKI